ncbi:differentially expressed in FDCP 8 homolog isoform X2 [Anthonomus grandis grandis]|uniref:differentially expressed in FDCP 8 homolog isoform X2 n=1 Tax=Anthonomus grandis grandis TaxID=2921223 RepID=UPI0021669775|nr:differentially expressed in FDCP 8 homolog isoform X2 [Anthonomus grandis grandis]
MHDGDSISTPVSGQTSVSEDLDQLLPSSLALEELQLALCKEAAEQELTKAIGRCKELILENAECSTERKWLVRHLIELRLRLQEHREAMVDPQHPQHKGNNVSNRTIMGHHLKLQPLLKTATHTYCDHCTGTIWSVVQAWYKCDDCDFCCHYKCMSSIIRECAHVIACEKGQYELNICPEVGMSAQKYLCAECKTGLVINKAWSDVRRCDYNGLYYCSACHWDSSAIIPARVIHNWDFEARPVSQASLQILKVTSIRPLINLEKLNPQLFSRIQELKLVKRLRQELQGIKKYLVVCRKASDEHLVWKCERPHLMDNVDMYSLQDLVDTYSGDLPSMLHELVDIYSKHIKVDCDICKGNGHICEVCKNVEILFPFVTNSFVCKGCQAVFHKNCIERKKACPKCERLKKRKESEKEYLDNNNVDLFDETDTL